MGTAAATLTVAYCKTIGLACLLKTYLPCPWYGRAKLLGGSYHVGELRQSEKGGSDKLVVTARRVLRAVWMDVPRKLGGEASRAEWRWRQGGLVGNNVGLWVLADCFMHSWVWKRERGISWHGIGVTRNEILQVWQDVLVQVRLCPAQQGRVAFHLSAGSCRSALARGTEMWQRHHILHA